MFPKTMIDRESAKKILNDWMLKMSPFLSKKYEGREIIVLLDQVKKEIDKLTYYIPEEFYPAWRNPETDPPKVETEVLVLCSYGTGYCITTAFYEDGTVLQHESRWDFEDLEDYGIYDEKNDEYRIPKGWWENRHYCPDDVPDYKVDDPVVGWMPLPPKEERR